MKLFKRILSVTLAFVLMLGVVPSVLAASYTVNGVSLPLSGYASGVSHTNCWEFAQMVYKKLWNNTSFTSYRNTSDDMLRSVGDGSARTVTAANAQRFISQATLGAVIRLSPSSHLNQADGNGHSQILIQKDSNGFTTYESNVNSGKVRIKYWTWAEYAKSGSSGGWATQYGTGATLYFKYIKWPSAQAFGEQAVGIDTRYPTPFIANTLLWWNTSDGKTPVYDSINGNHSGNIYNGYNNNDDDCTIQEVYTNGWCKVMVPGLSGVRYCQLSVFASVIDGYNPWWVKSPSTLDVYRRWDHGSPVGSMPGSVDVCIISETDKMYQVIYPVDGVYYCRWVDRCVLKHIYTAYVTSPTCTAQGYTTNTCKYCGYSYKDTYTNATGHSYSYKATKAPTTSATGTLTGTCSKCKGTTTVTLPKLNTTDYNYTVKTAATCTAAGTGRYTWKTTTYGSFYFDVAISAKGHSYTTKVTAPTCTAQGYTTHTCSCGYSYKDTYTNATGHSYSYKTTKAPTTSATGTLTGTCSKCKGTTTVTLPKLNTTDYTCKVALAATCTGSGVNRYTWKTTTYGSFYFDVPTDKAAHSWKAATCTSAQTCSVCGTTSGLALGHSYSYKATKAPTTSATGTLTGTCSKCKGTTTVTLPKLNTTDYSYTVKTAATCTAVGTGRYTWKTTTYGSFYFDVTIAAKGHSYTHKVTSPTCTAQGYTTHTCSCGYSYKDTYTNATGHSYSYKTTKTPTTSATGTLTGTCSKCKGTTAVTLPKLNTTDYSYAVKTAATCTAAGTGRYTWKTTTYGSFYFDVAISAKGHSYTTKVTAPTCTAQGYTTHTCSCGYSYKDTYTNATGHSYSYKATKAPTTSAIGTLTGTCSKCKGTTSVTIPKLNTADYSYVVRTEPTYTSTGVGRYTWKTTTYGSFYFDVTLDQLTASGQIIVHNGVAAPGATVTLTVELKNNPGIAYLAVTPVYDASVLKLVSVENGDIIHDFDHDTNFSWSAAENSTANGVMMRLTFEIADNAAKGDYTVSLKFREAYNYDEQDVGFAVESGVITVSDILYGDANGDGVVNGKDVLLLRKYMANYDYDTGNSGITVHSGGDANGDGMINGKDVLLMRKYMANYDYDTGTSTIVLGPSQ